MSASCIFALLLCLAPQDPQQPVFALGDAAHGSAPVLGNVTATLDPFGTFTITGADAAGARRELRIRFDELEFPTAGRSRFGDERGIAAWLDGTIRSGDLEVVQFGHERIALQGTFTAPDVTPLTFRVDAVPALAPVQVIGGDGPRRALPLPGRAAPGDLVFCALGNAGTGRAAQRAIGTRISELAQGFGTPAFVALLGDLFAPHGVGAIDSPLWNLHFREPYPDHLLPVPFHYVPGPRDPIAGRSVLQQYGRLDARWTCAETVHVFERQSHDKTLLFIGVDTGVLLGPLTDAATRHARHTLARALKSTEAHLRIVYGHTSLATGSASARLPATASMRQFARELFTETGVDLYISAGDHHLELITEPGRPVEVITGGGGGIDRARTAVRGPHTAFAHTGGGFVWFHFDGVRLAVSFRDAAGEVLFVHHVHPR